jgi:hypothetical protein
MCLLFSCWWKKNKPKLLVDISISIAICFVLQNLQGLVNVQTFSHEQTTGDVLFVQQVLEGDLQNPQKGTVTNP